MLLLHNSNDDFPFEAFYMTIDTLPLSFHLFSFLSHPSFDVIVSIPFHLARNVWHYLGALNLKIAETYGTKITRYNIHFILQTQLAVYVIMKVNKNRDGDKVMHTLFHSQQKQLNGHE